MLYKETFANNLLGWFEMNKRAMPWRETKDPYKIWLSEVMLQQTQVNTVKPYYNKFIERFPTIEALAETPIDEVVKYWEGLGYYSRVRNFHSAVREVHEAYQGIVPNDAAQFLSLKGVGPYTQGAVMSIAYNMPLPAVDGNVYRVFARLDDDSFDISKSSARKHFEQKVLEVMPLEAGPFNEALMELGATICTPKNPNCLLCPVRTHCEAYVNGTVLERPVKLKKVKRSEKRFQVWVVVDQQGNLLIERRPDTGLLAGMWQFPMFDEDSSLSTVEEILGVPLFVEGELMTLTHKFTHLDWILDVYIAKTSQIADGKYTMMAPEDKDQYTFPVSMTKIFESFLKSHR